VTKREKLRQGDRRRDRKKDRPRKGGTVREKERHRWRWRDIDRRICTETKRKGRRVG